MLKEMKELHAQGWAIHWLRPKSKAPAQGKWSSGPRKSWGQLKDEFAGSSNVGVRLGRASKLKSGGYLAAIDCDVKSTLKKHVKEMEAALSGLITVPAPSVASGRGNGSKHLYIATNEPVKPSRFARSEDIVKVQMPSNEKPSKKEIELLTGNEIAEGWRLRPAWEISIMGEGQQVVLPPSIHPDTNKPYVWINEGIPPIVELNSAVAKNENVDKSVGKFEVVDIDLSECDISDETKKLIETGENCSDRSAALFKVCIEMVKAGMSDAEILTILTNREFYLGECGFDHAKTGSRSKAALWILNHTLRKVKKEFSAEEQFKAEVVETKLSEQEAKEQLESIDGVVDWRAKLEKVSAQPGSPPKHSLKNVLLILRKAIANDVFKKDEFAGVEVYGCDTPWGGKKGHELADADDLKLKEWLANRYKFEPNRNLVFEATTLIAHENRFHPVRDWLNALPAWDGVARIDTWLKDYLNAEAAEPYLSAVSRKTLIAMVARVMHPGCKFDHVLILEGEQGQGKSTAARILADPWFSDAHIDISNKDSVMNMRSVWVLELGELSSMRQAEVNQLKGFITRQYDRMRPPYGRRSENFPRQSVFIGTTNPGEYLKDQTGNRRFWPVKVGQTDFDGLRKVRDQLLAEALFIYENIGENLWLDEKENVGALVAQGERTFVDAWVDILADFFTENSSKIPPYFSISFLFEDFGPLSGQKLDISNQMRAANALRALNFEKKRKRIGGARSWLWFKKMKAICV